MFFKFIKVIFAYIVACLITATFIVMTYYIPQMPNILTGITETIFIKNILALALAMMVFSLSVIAFLAPFAVLKKIHSVYFYAISGIFSIFVTLLFIPKYQGIKGDEAALWVPFVAFISSAFAGYVFWLIAIRIKSKKIS
ncbi:MAG: hypothetical protein HRU28_01620 [Rhizobiales bacterium]|nr:hypothetical protein [Hyphomicrobiales bacterium]